MPMLRVVSGHIEEREAYETVVRGIRLHTEHPVGLLMHALGRRPDRIEIVQVWYSREYAERFDEETLIPALLAAGVDPGRRQITWTDLEDLVTP